MSATLSPVMLPGMVQQASAGSSGFDVNQVLSANDAKGLKDSGYDFCIRYIPRAEKLAAGNITYAEALDILNAGLALMVVQHVALPGWSPTADLGTAYGSYAATYIQQFVGFPPGVNIWCDLEGVANGTTAQDVIAYCRAWYNAVKAAGYIPGIYVGYDVVLSPEQLYQDLPFKHYWRAYNGPQVATRGYQLLQKIEVRVNHITIDPNIIQSDNLGGLPYWLTTDDVLV
jgi:hypothetical protein